MKRLHITVMAFALACALVAAPVSAASLAEARQATDARDYQRALQQFNEVLQTQPDNADLLIETARVYGFADRHREAIATYRRVLAAAPQRRNDIVAALAWQTLWAGDGLAAKPLFVEAQALAKTPRERADLLRGEGEACAAFGDVPCALDAWQRALAQQPQDRDLRRRIATAYLWLDDYAMSEAQWRALLREDPLDKRAQAGLARTLNAAGRHNEAVAMYRSIDDGSDADLRFDHARALRWAGYDAPAYVLPAGRTDADAVWLRDFRLGRELKSYVYGTLEYATDSDQLDILSATAAAGTLIAPAVVVEGGYRFARIDGRDGSVNGNRLFATVRGAFGTPGEAPMGLLVPSLSLGINDYGGWTPVTGNAALRWQPADLWRLSFDLGRELVETPLAIQNRITVDVAAVGVEYRLPPRWAFAAGLSNLSFSDGNDRKRVTGKVDYALRFANPRILVGVEGAAFNDSLPASFTSPPSPGTTTPKGYWNPKDYVEGRIFAGFYYEQQPWEWYGRVALGISRETDGDGVLDSDGNPNLLEFGVARRPGTRLALAARLPGRLGLELCRGQRRQRLLAPLHRLQPERLVLIRRTRQCPRRGSRWPHRRRCRACLTALMPSADLEPDA